MNLPTPCTRYPERDKPQQLTASDRKGEKYKEQTLRSHAWQTWSVPASLLSRTAVAVHGVQLDLRSWKALGTQRARYVISSCRTALRHGPASIFISIGLRKKRKKLARQLIVLFLFFCCVQSFTLFDSYPPSHRLLVKFYSPFIMYQPEITPLAE